MQNQVQGLVSTIASKDGEIQQLKGKVEKLEEEVKEVEEDVDVSKSKKTPIPLNLRQNLCFRNWRMRKPRKSTSAPTLMKEDWSRAS